MSFFLIGINYSAILSYYKKPLDIPVVKTIKIGLFNVFTSNNQYDKLLDEIKCENPDIVILQEVNNLWILNVQSLREKYPYYKDYPREDNFGVSIYSKIPMKDIKVEFWSNRFIPVIVADTGDIKIYCTHTLPPASFDYIRARNEMLQKIGNILGSASEKGENVIVAGDLNTTVFSKAYILAKSSGKDYLVYDAINYMSKNGIRNSGTWNAFYPPFFRITLEHILTTKNIAPVKTYFGNTFGSDHIPVFAEFNILKR